MKQNRALAGWISLGKLEATFTGIGLDAPIAEEEGVSQANVIGLALIGKLGKEKALQFIHEKTTEDIYKELGIIEAEAADMLMTSAIGGMGLDTVVNGLLNGM